MFEFEFINWKLIRTENDGRRYDNLTVPFSVKNVPAGWTWELLIRHGSDLNVIPLIEAAGGTLTYEMTADDLTFRGEYAVQLRATAGNLVKHTSIETICVPDSLSGDAQWPTLPTVFSEAVDQAEAAADRAEAATVHAPIIGDNGTWWIWNQQTAQYEDTGIPVSGGGGSTWNLLPGKPFERIGETLAVNEGTLDVNIHEVDNPAGGRTTVIG